MRRRDVNVGLVAAAAAGALELTSHSTSADDGPKRPAVGILIYPDMILQDLVGPLTVFNILQADVRLIAASDAAVATDVGVAVAPTHGFDSQRSGLDVLFIPGGLKGTIAAIQDARTLDFVATTGSSARYVTSVCTGSLLLGAAGLLKGYRATSHWYVRDLLPLVGAAVGHERVVEDRNRMTGGGVTAGLDFGLTIAARLAGDETARRIALLLEYDPHPPFATGTPEQAGPALAADIRSRRGAVIEQAEHAMRAAGARLGI